MKTCTRACLIFLTFLLIWECISLLTDFPHYILPAPHTVFMAFQQHWPLLLKEAVPTITETLLGLLLGTLFGMVIALCMSMAKWFKWWLMPVLLISQALPTFAVAPLLVIWFGYGITSKIIMTMIMLFFPVTSNFYQGLSQTPDAWINYAKLQQLSRFQTLRHIQLPAALPDLFSGIKIATAIAPVGAIVGEWVGSNAGLGFLMLNSNARMDTALMFAALFVLVIFSLSLYGLVSLCLNKILPWSHQKSF